MSYKEYSRFLDQNKLKKKKINFRQYLPSRLPFYEKNIVIGREYVGKSYKNLVRNQKYSILTFLPLVLYEQFKFFLNSFFLCIAMSQFIEVLKVGNPVAYWTPLGFVLSVTIIREAYEDFSRFLRDRKLNNQEYSKFDIYGLHQIKSRDIRVGDVLLLHKNQRIPADAVLLRTSEKSGSCFIKTDQLDGETDWKLKHAVPVLQEFPHDEDIFNKNCEIFAESSKKDIYNFIGTCRTTINGMITDCSLSIENILWSSTTLTAGTALVLVIYTGEETRVQLNRPKPHHKVGLLDLEIDNITKLLFCFLVLLVTGSMAMKRPQSDWPRLIFRFILIYSYMLPISLKVNLEIAKLFFSFLIERDKSMPGIQVRTSSIPEELGRIAYLLTDKTGTLTKNEMVFKKLHIGSVSLGEDSFPEIRQRVEQNEVKSSMETKILAAIRSIALCHNVTPVIENESKSYQASSPDEIALVEWTEQVGCSLKFRDQYKMTLNVNELEEQYEILHIFPFTPERKRMGIITQNSKTNEIIFHNKGADSVISTMVGYNDWLEEECINMAREGLRTMAFASKILSQRELERFNRNFHAAKMSTIDRAQKMEEAIKSIEIQMNLVCLTGVEDQLQNNVRASIESLIQAGIKVCMLTGDKQETAVSIARSCGLIQKASRILIMNAITVKDNIFDELEKIKEKLTPNSVLLVSGTEFEHCLEFEEESFSMIFDLCETVVIYRCSPDEKAKLAKLLKKFHPKARVAAIGDGGNDVAMIQEAHVGIGIESKEGKQASLAADFALNEFSSICTLLMVHGRNAYRQNCILAQFVMYRGLMISVIQAIHCFLNHFVTLLVFNSFLMMNYTILYTPLAVFSILTDRDTSRAASLTYSELYKELRRGKFLTLKTFLIWVLICIYQDGILYYGFYFLGDFEYEHFTTVVFSALVLTELLMVFVVVQRLTWAMIIGELQCFLALVASWFILSGIFDRDYVTTWHFPFLLFGLTSVAVGPLFIIKIVIRRYAPSNATKVK